MRLIKKQMTALILIMFISVMNLPILNNYFTHEVSAITFDEINHPNVFLKQKNGDLQCTLVAATMLIRRTAMLSGNANWADITVDKVKRQAWVEGVGLRYTFTYEGITVNKASFGADPVNESLQLLKLHPEGIVLFDQIRSPRSHAVLLTDYTNGMFYCADPSDAVPYGRIPISSGLVQVKDTEYYYYISNPSTALLSPPAIEESSTMSSTGDNSITPETAENNMIPGTAENNIVPSTVENSITSVIDINTYSATLSRTSFYYDGTDKKPGVTISGLTENVDYTVSYLNNNRRGSAYVIITGIGVYSGAMIKSFEIKEGSSFDYINEIKVATTKQTIQKGKTAAIKVTLPDPLKLVKEYSSNVPGINNEVKVTYQSGNKKIAVVNSNGKITGKLKGTTTISATAELADGTNKVFTFKITVK